MTYEELKSYCDLEIKKYPQYKTKYKREILMAKIFYENGRDLYKELIERRDEVSKRYIIPFLLNLTNEVKDLEPEKVQVKNGASGGIDIDSDFSPEGKEKVQEYLKIKYGEDKVFHVGTYSSLGPASAAKDLLRVYKVDFKESVAFTKELNKDLTWEDNIKLIETNNPTLYKFYLKYKTILDLTPYFINKIRQVGKHAGGVVITPEPIYNYIPVDRVSGEVITAFPENGQETILDELGIVKLDLLGITVLEVIDKTLDLINEKLYLIEEDGIQKIVPQSYIDEEIKKF